MSSSTNHKVVVIGGGYAGALAAVRLAGRARGRAEITLVEPRDEIVQRLRLHQVAAGRKVRRYPLAPALGRRVTHVRGHAVAVDPERGAVAYKGADGKLGEVRFDQALLALGSTVEVTAVPGVAEHAHTLADPSAAIRLREAFAALPEGARVAVCGGGFTGVEAVAELAAARPDLHLSIHTAGRLGGGLSTRGSEALAARLVALDVEVVEGERIAAVEPGRLLLVGGDTVAADLTIWCGGFVAHPLAADSHLPTADDGRLLVDPTLRSLGAPNVLGAGDAAAIPTLPNGAAYRMTCQAGMPSGAHAADVALAVLRDEEPQRFDFGYIHVPLSLGRGNGLIQFVDRADRPKDKILVGRRAALYKEMVTRLAIPSIGWERRLPGALRWPAAGEPVLGGEAVGAEAAR
jgi:NADH:ubiquinone reductase (H+-translocating)